MSGVAAAISETYMSSTMNPNSIVPLYKQVIKSLMNRISAGEFPIGTRIPSETALMEEFGVSRITIRAAIAELVEEGVLERMQGKGTFVASPKSLYTADDQIGFSRSCQMAGKTPTTKLISLETAFPTQQVALFLNIAEGEKIICSKRLRFVDSQPTMLETNYYPLSFSFLLSENLNNSLFDILRKHNIVVATGIRTLEVCSPTYEEVSLLGIPRGKSLLLFKDKQFDAQQRPLFFSKQLYCTDRMKFYL